MKKYWIYYYKKTNELYAYTDNKKFAKEFERVRDMDKFEIISEEIDKEMINQLAREYQNKYLKKYPIKIYDKKNLKWMDSELLVTVEESIGIQNIAIQQMQETLYKHCWDDPYIFKKKIYDALEVLGYNKIYYTYIMAQTGMYEDTDLNITSDELGIFIRYYGKTLK